MKPLPELSEGEVVALLNNWPSLKPFSAAINSNGVSGMTLLYVNSVQDIKEWGVPGAQANMLFSMLGDWKVNDVERSLLA